VFAGGPGCGGDKPSRRTLAESTELVRLAGPSADGLITVYQDRRWDGDLATESRKMRTREI